MNADQLQAILGQIEDPDIRAAAQKAADTKKRRQRVERMAGVQTRIRDAAHAAIKDIVQNSDIELLAERGVKLEVTADGGGLKVQIKGFANLGGNGTGNGTGTGNREKVRLVVDGAEYESTAAACTALGYHKDTAHKCLQELKRRNRGHTVKEHRNGSSG